jgi:hypothetical protein
MNDPVISIKDLVKDNWTAANTSGVTPYCHTGWWDTKSNHVQITFTDPSKVVVAGGAAHFTGMTSSGVPAKLWDCTLTVNIWITRESAGKEPKQLRFEMEQEVDRILKKYFEEISDLQYVTWKGGFGTVESDPPPTVYRLIGEVGYAYLD